MDREKSRVGFYQSLGDFPCLVSLGNKTASFGLHRFDRGLKFIPADDEGFTLRGDKQRLVYKGRRRSHRFTILGDTAFEYDCILNREPDSNVISLLMEGAENYDFFRQPDFLKDPLLAGSYAVYKKETLIGEGTGKLCHIHRPEIIDSRGRRCWGKLDVVDNRLFITIPEEWLSEAKYPVVVDPTVGTSTVGSLIEFDEWELFFEMSIPINRFTVPETINGLCTAYLYSNAGYYDDEGGRPVLYSDNGNVPHIRRSTQEALADLRVNGSKPPGWRTAAFSSNEPIPSGSNIWFGVCTEYIWFPRYDYGAKCYTDWWDEYESIPEVYPLYYVDWYENFKLSMYFTYTGVQNYIRTLTQGVTISDIPKLTGNYKRSIEQTVGINTLIGRFKLYFLKIQETVKGFDSNFSLGVYIRTLHEKIKNTDTVQRISNYIRSLYSNADIESKAKGGRFFAVVVTDIAHAAGSVFRGLLLFIRITTGAFIRDYIIRRFLKSKTELELKSTLCREIILESNIK